jgi:hypothetical protein
MTTTTSRYDYDQRVWAEIEHMLRMALPTNSRLERAPLEDDFGGVDAVYLIDQRTPVALRVRYDRPAYAADIDVTFRTTEPRKMEQHTYAPLILFIWIKDGFAKAGKLVDVYRLYHSIEPPLEDREPHDNHDGTFWIAVMIEELVATRSLLGQGGRDKWAPAALAGDERTKRIIKNWSKR